MKISNIADGIAAFSGGNAFTSRYLKPNTTLQGLSRNGLL